MAQKPLTRDPAAPRLRLVRGTGARSTEDQDQELIGAFRGGLPGSGARLYDRLLPAVDATLYRILGRRGHEHADLVQSTFEQIVSTLTRRTFAGDCSLVGWAITLACHVGLNAIRSQRRERGVLDRGREADAPPDPGGACATTPEARLRARDELATVRLYLAEMDRDRVTAVLLNAMGYELPEIARLIGTSVAAAQSRLSRGRRELRARLEQPLPPPVPATRRP